MRNTYNAFMGAYRDLGITATSKLAPLYGSMNGYVYNDGTMRSVWQDSYYWSGNVAASASAGFWRLPSGTTQTPVGSSQRTCFGAGIRCVAR